MASPYEAELLMAKLSTALEKIAELRIELALRRKQALELEQAIENGREEIQRLQNLIAYFKV